MAALIPHNSIEKRILEGYVPGCHKRGRPRRRLTQDIKDLLNMTSAEAGHLMGRLALPRDGCNEGDIQ